MDEETEGELKASRVDVTAGGLVEAIGRMNAKPAVFCVGVGDWVLRQSRG